MVLLFVAHMLALGLRLGPRTEQYGNEARVLEVQSILNPYVDGVDTV
jgi:hypothetical protein